MEKVRQLEPKVSAARRNISKTLDLLGINIKRAYESDWKVVGIVVIDGYSGVVSPTADLPIIPHYVFTTGIRKCENLHIFFEWLQSLVWLPQLDIHFESIPVKASFGEFHVHWEAMDIKGFAEDYLRIYLPQSVVNIN